MKMTLAVTLISLAGSFASTLPGDPRVIPVFVSIGNTTGSGCFFRNTNFVYFATARHVLFDQQVGTNLPLRANSALLKSFSESGSNVLERIISLDLAQLQNAGHIKYSTNRDVAIVRVQVCNPRDLNNVGNLPGVVVANPVVTTETTLTVSPLDSLCPFSETEVGASVFMFGYPTSLTAKIADLFSPTEPLVRSGIVAGVNRSKRTVIIDCPAYFGNSGGPVLQVQDVSIGVKTFRIIGLVSAFIPFEEEWKNQTMNYSHTIKSNSGYTVIEPIELALELAD